MKINVRQMFLFSSLAFVLWAGPSITYSEQPSFTIETLTGQRAHISLGLRAAGKSLIISEPISLPSPCYWVAAEVQRHDFEIVVKLRPKENLSSDMACAQVMVEAVARLTLPHLPSGAYSVLIETPQKTTGAMITIE